MSKAMMNVLAIIAGAAVIIVLALYLTGNLPGFLDGLMAWFKGKLGM